MATALRWGIIGAGGIARTFARGLEKSKTGKLVAVGSRTREKAEAFGAEMHVPAERCYGGYDELLADAQVQAVYIATPHPMHAQWAIRAAEAGRHILCEKPIGINQYEAMAIVEAARRHDVFLMEAFMYRCHPQTARLVELVRQGAVGEVRVIQATFSFHAGFSPDGRLFANELGGGGILDVGCYCTSLSRLVAGAALGLPFAEPLEVRGAGHLGQTGVDEWAVATARFPGDILAQWATGVSLNQENVVRVFGSEGHILVPSPWIPAREGGAVKILVKANRDKEPREIQVKTSDFLYALEADTVAANLERRQAPSPAMSWDDTLGNMRALDLWRASFGFTYAREQAANARPVTLAGRPLAHRAGHPMPYGRIPCVDKPVARLVMGVDNQGFFPHAEVMFDDYFTNGGNAFDTAWVYGREKSVNLGAWVKSRGVREEVVLICKGAHTPLCTPQAIAPQLEDWLGWAETGYCDIYMLHRDNPEVPVGEFVEALNEQVRAGRICAFGGSNWALQRVEEANAYAQARGLQGFTVVSNNMSLAEMVEPVWTGCLHVSDAASRAWFTRTQIPLLPWSSQARGFFTERADFSVEQQPDREMVRCWYSPANLERRRRATELARRRGVLPINVALAYVLCQPFPTFPLIGPRALAETRTSLPALNVSLSPAELAWLNLESEEAVAG
ncbi:MAG: aldo/keto reductase [Candidatus Latescibacterota bacterium]